jgi:hypothetical protein
MMDYGRNAPGLKGWLRVAPERRRWQALGESNPSSQNENLVS